jgi:hypothetical protein
MRYLTHRRTLRTRCVALVTHDAVLYSELAAELRERHVPSVSLLPGQRIPDTVAVVLTTAEESSRIHHPRVLAVPAEGDRTALWAEVASALAQDPIEELVVGIDPGPRPGYAVLAGGRCIAEGVLDDPEAVARLGAHLRRRFPSQRLRFRVGSGDRLSRDRILNALLAVQRPVELVDEQGTTPRGHRRPRDPAAARAIAGSEGRPVRDRTPLTTRPGEVANLQRQSREGSDGRFTISRHQAERVLRGELTLNEAIAEGQARYAPRPSTGRRRHAAGEPS